MDERNELKQQTEEQAEEITAQAPEQMPDAAPEQAPAEVKEFEPDPQNLTRGFFMIIGGAFMLYIAWQMAKGLLAGGRSFLSALGMGAATLCFAALGVFLIYYYGKKMVEK